MTSNWKVTISWIATVALVLLLKDRVDKHGDVRDDRENYSAYLDSTRHYKDRYNRVVAERRAMELSSARILEENDSLKELVKGMKPSVIVRVETVYRDTGTIKFDTVYKGTSIPFNLKNEWRHVSGRVLEDGIHFNRFEVYSNGYLTVGTRKKFLGNTEYIARYVNENPYVTTSLQPIVIRHSSKWYEKWWLWGIIGITGGILITR